MKPFLSLHNVLPRLYESPFSIPFNWQINDGEVWSIIGRNGSGKTLFSDVLCGKYNLIQGEIKYHFIKENEQKNPKQFIKTISFNSVYSIANFRDMYYQQRFNSIEAEQSPMVADFFNADDIQSIDYICHILNLQKLMSRRLIQLSSGELRKLLIAKILLEKPRMLIFDNPFIGLDINSRKQLDEAFHHLSQTGIQLVFLIPSISDLPTCTSHILEMQKGKILATKEVHHAKIELTKQENVSLQIDWNVFIKNPKPTYHQVVKMNNVEISYGTQIINKGVNWTIKKGDKWSLMGPNGSGKSTFLSYIFADNPQAYSKDLTLFGNKRGTGESIWEIKKRIGFTSSEMHLYYRENVSCLKVVESGFFDSIGLFRKCNEEQNKIAEYLFEILHINHIKERSFLKISSGEQRMILFARSLVKNPELLILDEPFHGLDDENKNRCIALVESYAKQYDKSLIFVTHNQDEIPDCVHHFLSLG